MHFCSVSPSWISSKWNVGKFMDFRLTAFILFNCNHLYASSLVWLVFPVLGWATAQGSVMGAQPWSCPAAILRHTEEQLGVAAVLPTRACGQEGLHRRRRHQCTHHSLLCINGAHRSCGTMMATLSSTLKQHSLANHISAMPCSADVPPKSPTAWELLLWSCDSPSGQAI